MFVLFSLSSGRPDIALYLLISVRLCMFTLHY